MKKAKTFNVTPKALKVELQNEAKILGLPSSTSDLIIERVMKRITKWLEERPAVTETDLNRKLASELKKYNTDLAYVYQNRGKII